MKWPIALTPKQMRLLSRPARNQLTPSLLNIRQRRPLHQSPPSTPRWPCKSCQTCISKPPKATAPTTSKSRQKRPTSPCWATSATPKNTKTASSPF